MHGKKNKYNARFPPARIKKIMQKDDEVGKVAAPVPVIISRVLELFVEGLLTKTGKITADRKARTLTPSHLKQCISSEKRYDFLTELFSNIAEVSLDPESDCLPFNDDATPTYSRTMSGLQETANVPMSGINVAARKISLRGRGRGRGRPKSTPSSSDPKVPRARGRPRKVEVMKPETEIKNMESDEENGLNICESDEDMSEDEIYHSVELGKNGNSKDLSEPSITQVPGLSAANISKTTGYSITPSPIAVVPPKIAGFQIVIPGFNSPIPQIEQAATPPLIPLPPEKSAPIVGYRVPVITSLESIKNQQSQLQNQLPPQNCNLDSKEPLTNKETLPQEKSLPSSDQIQTSSSEMSFPALEIDEDYNT